MLLCGAHNVLSTVSRLAFGGKTVFENGQFCINAALEEEIYAQFKSAEVNVMTANFTQF
jgi:hypothetical protein